ncbi:lipopolysaccharide transport system ATP-binding protein [Polaromonas sp. YR568]|uniref:ABC transporter ATP-binding protein n=1 Tax=Polaromonas sp. YR568 TaxID=1855301 RepID=UPI0008E8D5AC|nr:ABC transporter ATP-binding protein [Polaromonas sp. YR568]SFV01837.1 lipopolysaccharide transport system ATP-binding protein [Polaromonas sp. YR568]
MRSDAAISVKNLTKTYRIFGHPGDRIKQALTLGRMRFHREFTAVKDVTFEIKKGATVGIIGRNGSGKSTLLQLICGILTPTAGTVKVNGRICALLELGAGFNPEFTGSENIYFQGALMGLSKDEMDSRFDGIVKFADIGAFIDQPVRTYSSGMFVRLAFAVATSVDAEVILIDEAMAVGDLAFQSRCFSRIHQLKSKGVTFLLVSHSMAQILNNADSALLMDRGSILMHAEDVKSVVAAYEAAVRNTSGAAISEPEIVGTGAQTNAISRTQLGADAVKQTRQDLHENRFGTFEAIITKVAFLQNKSESLYLCPGTETVVRFHIESSGALSDVVLGISIRLPGTGDLWGDNNLLAEHPLTLHPGRNTIEYVFDLPVSNGEYLVYCGLAAFEFGNRIEIDQRWPVEQITVASDRVQIGHIYAPVTVRVAA